MSNNAEVRIWHKPIPFAEGRALHGDTRALLDAGLGGRALHSDTGFTLRGPAPLSAGA